MFRPRLIEPARFFRRLERISDSRTYTNGGSQTAEFSSRLADHFGVTDEHIVLGSSATSLLSGSAQVLGGDRYFCPSWTFTATPTALINAGCDVVFIDIDRTSQVANLDPVPSSSSVAVVAPFGANLNVGREFNRFSTIIIDAAASIAHPVTYDPDFVNFERVIEVYSLHATKVFGVGEGGVAVARDIEVAKKLRSWTNFGFSGSRVSESIGANAKMSEFHAAIGCETFASYDSELSEWQLARKMVWNVEETLGLRHFFASNIHVSPYWVCSLPADVDMFDVMGALDRAGIDTRLWWGEGCHRMPAFQEFGSLGDLPNTESVARRTVGLPFSRDISEAHVNRIEIALSEVLASGDGASALSN